MAIDEEAFEFACKKVKDIDPKKLRSAIHSVNRRWIADRRRLPRSEINFHEYYGLSLAEKHINIQPDDSRADRHRKALGAYFNQRAVKAIRERRGIPPAPKHGVEEADPYSVLIRVVPEISVRYCALKESGKLKIPDVKEVRKKVHYGPEDQRPSEELVHSAKVQALAIMNEKRGYKSKRKRKKRN